MTRERMAQVAALVSREPVVSDELFTPTFLQAADARQVATLMANIHRAHGDVADVDPVGPFGAVWVWRWTYTDGFRAAVKFAVEAAPPHRVSTLLIGPAWSPDLDDNAHVTRARLRLPFRGAWTVSWGGRSREDNHHHGDRAQRYAYDFVIVRDGKTRTGDGKRNEDYHCFGEPILAPGEGTVLVAVDGREDQTPGVRDEEQPLGNHVVLDHGTGEFTVLAHLQRGSVSLRSGERVAAGHVVGRCGNSGRSSEPHLHVHLEDVPVPLEGEGLPMQFLDYDADGRPVERGEPIRGQVVEQRENRG